MSPTDHADEAGGMVCVAKRSNHGGRYWNHMQEVNEALRGLRNHAEALEGVTNPAAQAARQRALDAIKQVEEATKGHGI